MSRYLYDFDNEHLLEGYFTDISPYEYDFIAECK